MKTKNYGTIVNEKKHDNQLREISRLISKYSKLKIEKEIEESRESIYDERN